MKVFVSGIKGFIGSHLAQDLIKEGHNVLGVDNLSHPSSNKLPKSTFQWGDVRYYSQVSSFIANADVVFHLAAEINVDKSINEPQYVFDSNVNGSLNILEGCRKFKKRLILASSSEVYGSAMTASISEDHPLNGQSPYAASKTAADRLAYSYWQTYGLPVTIVRNFNTFGTHQSFDSYGGVIGKFTYRALKGLPPQIYGDGEQERDYMNVEDAVVAYKTCLQDGMEGKVVNFGTGKTVKVRDIASMVCKYTKSSVVPEYVEARPGEVQKLCADITQARSYGFEPKTDFERDLASYINWFQTQ